MKSPNTKGLRAFHINVHSLRNKMDEEWHFCDTNKPHVLAVNETWLDDSFSDAEVSIPEYNVFRRDRNYNGGGVAIYVAKNLTCNRINLTWADNIEGIWVEISQPFSSKIILESVHRPPDSDPINFNYEYC